MSTLDIHDMQSIQSSPEVEEDIPIPLDEDVHEVVVSDVADGLSFVCEEEPHMVKHLDALGYIPLHLGDRLGNEGQYEVVRKLGWASSSSVWLTFCHRPRTGDPRYMAIKVLNADATTRELFKGSYELKVLLEMKEKWDVNHPGTSHCLKCLGAFYEDSVHGRHLCLAFTPCGSTLDGLLHEQPSGRFALPVVKRFVKQTLQALDFLHTRVSAVHCDVKLSNLFVKIDPSNAVISKYLQECPSESYPVHHFPDLWDGPIITVKSQPLPNFGLDPSLSNLDVYLSDFGGAIPLDQLSLDTEHCTPITLEAPEQILECIWSTPVDIWAVGCMVFLSLTGMDVFELYRTSRLDYVDVHLARIVEHVGPFPGSFLERCEKRAEHFDDAGRLLKVAMPNGGTIEDRLNLALSGTLDKEDIQMTAAFVRRCLSIDPDERPTAAQLLEDHWFVS